MDESLRLGDVQRFLKSRHCYVHNCAHEIVQWSTIVTSNHFCLGDLS
jgi:hypothetical protein